MASLGHVLKPLPDIYASKFFEALKPLWLGKSANLKCKRSTRIGIAVSGGVDSMALAQLCRGFKERYSLTSLGVFHFTAFIVDHRSREGSSLVVERTAQRLDRMGLNPKILSLKWPEGTSTCTLSNFETQARRLRYQALGRACAEANIFELLSAHHMDDHVETVLMRLAAGHRGKGLRGMTESLPIPECWGIHGVSGSGTFEKADKRQSRLQDAKKYPGEPLKELFERSPSGKPAIFESGGIILRRPLLRFTKNQLRQICEAGSVEWEEDESNQDISLTPRNTIRSLLLNNRLPLALQKDSLLTISSRRSREINEAHGAGLTIFERCNINFFDARSSFLCVHLPKYTLTLPATPEIAKISAGAYCLKEIASLVSPLESLGMGNMELVARLLFSDLRDQGHAASLDSGKSTNFTTCGVHFERVHLNEHHLKRMSSRTETPKNELDPDYVWVLSRQPFGQRPMPLIVPAISTSLAETSNSTEPGPPSGEVSSHQRWSRWQLWDGRFWIRIRNHSTKTLVVRAWESRELRGIRDSIPRPTFTEFYRTLEFAAPNKIRWTLPVIAEATEEEIEITSKRPEVGDGRLTDTFVGNEKAQTNLEHQYIPRDNLGKILVFPTLGKAGWLDILDEKGNRKFEWEVRYKCVSLWNKIGNGQVHPQNFDFVKAWDDGGQGSVRPASASIASTEAVD